MPTSYRSNVTRTGMPNFEVVANNIYKVGQHPDSRVVVEDHVGQEVGRRKAGKPAVQVLGPRLHRAATANGDGVEIRAVVVGTQDGGWMNQPVAGPTELDVELTGGPSGPIRAVELG